MKMIKDLWRGEITLWKSYWLCGVLVSILQSPLWLITERGSELFGADLAFIALAIVVVTVPLYSVVWSVGTWRSATNYLEVADTEPDGRLWKRRKYAFLAKGSIIIGWTAPFVITGW